MLARIEPRFFEDEERPRPRGERLSYKETRCDDHVEIWSWPKAGYQITALCLHVPHDGGGAVLHVRLRKAKGRPTEVQATNGAVLTNGADHAV